MFELLLRLLGSVFPELLRLFLEAGGLAINWSPHSFFNSSLRFTRNKMLFTLMSPSGVPAEKAFSALVCREDVLHECSAPKSIQQYFGEIKNEVFFKERAFL